MFYFLLYLCNNKIINIYGDDFMNTEIEKLIQIFKDSNNIVFFGAAGVSTEYSIETHKKIVTIA